MERTDRRALSLGTPTTQYVETKTSPADGMNQIWSRNYFDGLGRTYKQTAIGDSGGSARGG